MKRLINISGIITGCILYLFLLPVLNAQNTRLGTPIIKNYNSIDYKASPQNFAVVQDKDGIMYFGNTGVVLEYDGTRWRSIKIKNDYAVLSLAIDSLGVIYVSAGNEFGFLAPDSLGALKYNSLSSILDIKDIHDEDNGKTFVTKEGVYFQTYKFLYRFPFASIYSYFRNKGKLTKSDLKPTIFNAETNFTNSYMVNNERIFVHQSKIGLMELINDKLEKLTKGSYFVDDYKTVSIMPYKRRQVVIATESGIFYYTPGSGFGDFKSETDAYFNQIALLNATATPDVYAMATMNKGIIIMERNQQPGKKRSIVEQFDKQAGLTSEQVTTIYNNYQFDPNLIWLTSHYGISRTKINAPLRKVNEAQTVKDVILDLTYFKNNLYARTFGEIYILKDTEQGKQFKGVNNLISNSDWLVFPVEFPYEVNEVRTREIQQENKGVKRIVKKYTTKKITSKVKVVKSKTDDRILVGSKNNFYQIGRDTAKEVKIYYKVDRTRKNKEIEYQVYKYDKTLDYNISKICRSAKYPNRIYVGLENGFSVLSQQNHRWVDEGRLDSITENISFIAEDAKGVIWLGVKNNGVIRVQFDNEYKTKMKNENGYAPDSLEFSLFPSNAIITRYGEQHGLSKLVGNGFYRYNGTLLFGTREGLYRFDDSKSKFVPDYTFGKELADGSTRVLALREDKNGNCWLVSQTYNKTEVCFFQKKGALFVKDTQTAKMFPNMTVQSIFPDTTGMVWISGTEGLFSYNTNAKKDSLKNFTTLIRKVVVGKDSLLYNGTSYSDGEITHNQSFDLIPNLSPEMRTIRFEFAAPFFDNEDATQYSYYLEGFDTEWSGWGNSVEKEYTNLVPNTYVFHVKARNVYGTESKQADYKFTILTPWYERWWFYTLEIGLFILLIFISIFLNRKGHGSARITSILTMIAVVAIFKLLGSFVFTPLVAMFSKGVYIYKILLDIAIGAALLPAWTFTDNFIRHGKINVPKEEKDIDEKDKMA